ncbi:hypothetical protein MVEN_01825200 [Mycena venus]|uniref:Fungal lipase-type domain-containing protein n=1 Tax=Mycena venus TaxID=2733690 RepID=A0A8H6XKZ8_9AGAR|nr:hypothetical protein MVEN_01825200 [Mycena venus]
MKTTLHFIMLASFIFCFTFTFVAHAAPLFGLGSSEATGAPTPVSLATVNATLSRPAQFARAAYCPSASVESWNCGLPCDSLNGVTFLQAGGDQGAVPFYFIAHDSVDQSLVVAHEGTDPNNLLSLLNDAEFALVNVNTTSIPQAAGKGIKVHDGFQQTFQRTADGLLAGVKTNLASTGVKKVVVTGHSLGMHRGLFSARCRKLIAGMDSSASPSSRTKTTPSPLSPPLLFGFTHSAGEIHIVDASQTNIVSCPGHDNKNCATGNSLLHLSVQNHLGEFGSFF